MCQEIEVNDILVSNIGEARNVFKYLIIDKLYSKVKKEDIKDSNCLCCIDIPLTAEANDYHYDVEDSGKYILNEKVSISSSLRKASCDLSSLCNEYDHLLKKYEFAIKLLGDWVYDIKKMGDMYECWDDHYKKARDDKNIIIRNDLDKAMLRRDSL